MSLFSVSVAYVIVFRNLASVVILVYIFGSTGSFLFSRDTLLILTVYIVANHETGLSYSILHRSRNRSEDSMRKLTHLFILDVCTLET